MKCITNFILSKPIIVAYIELKVVYYRKFLICFFSCGFMGMSHLKIMKPGGGGGGGGENLTTGIITEKKTFGREL